MQVKDLKKSYRVIKKITYLDSNDVFEVLIWNGKKRTFDNLELARRALKEDERKEKLNLPIVVNGIGIETEKINTEVEYYIEWHWTSKWEKIGE